MMTAEPIKWSPEDMLKAGNLSDWEEKLAVRVHSAVKLTKWAKCIAFVKKSPSSLDEWTLENKLEKKDAELMRQNKLKEEFFNEKYRDQIQAVEARIKKDNERIEAIRSTVPATLMNTEPSKQRIIDEDWVLKSKMEVRELIDKELEVLASVVVNSISDTTKETLSIKTHGLWDEKAGKINFGVSNGATMVWKIYSLYEDGTCDTRVEEYQIARNFLKTIQEKPRDVDHALRATEATMKWAKDMLSGRMTLEKLVGACVKHQLLEFYDVKEIKAVQDSAKLNNKGYLELIHTMYEELSLAKNRYVEDEELHVAAEESGGADEATRKAEYAKRMLLTIRKEFNLNEADCTKCGKRHGGHGCPNLKGPCSHCNRRSHTVDVCLTFKKSNQVSANYRKSLQHIRTSESVAVVDDMHYVSNPNAGTISSTTSLINRRRKHQIPLPHQKRGLVLIDSGSTVGGISTDKEDFLDLAKPTASSHLRGTASVSIQGRGKFLGVIDGVYVPGAKFECAILSEAQLDLLHFKTEHLSNSEGKFWKRYSHPNSQHRELIAPMYRNGLYYANKKDTEEFLREVLPNATKYVRKTNKSEKVHCVKEESSEDKANNEERTDEARPGQKEEAVSPSAGKEEKDAQKI
jgi:hypothetical protein